MLVRLTPCVELSYSKVVFSFVIVESASLCFVTAASFVRNNLFNRAELKSLICKQPELFEKFAKAWVEEKSQANQLIVDLGRRTAEERIARLIMNLVDRLTKRKMVREEPVEFEFPLRQHHIADATGLTRVHVSKVLTEFRREGLININERSLTILDLNGFRRIAHMR